MLNLFLALIMIGFILTLFFGFIIWAIHEHSQASKWRRIVKFAQDQPQPKIAPNKVATQGWAITYKYGRKTRTEVFNATSEGEALRQATTMYHLGPKDIVDFKRV